MTRIRKRDNPRIGDDNIMATRSRGNRQKIDLFGKKLTPAQKAVLDEYHKARRAYESTQIPDPFKTVYTSSLTAAGPEHILPPPYNPYTLIKFPNENNTLLQCIDAMVINIEAYGYRLEHIGEEGEDESKEAIAEKIRLEALLEQPNEDYGLIEFRERKRRDKETLGYCFTEICRTEFGKEICSYYHVPAHTLRLTAQDREATEIKAWLQRDGKYVQQTVKKRFRRYIQEIGSRKVYFKEFGDPRKVSSRTGIVSEDTPDADLATEIYMENRYTPGGPYGVPCWINQLPAVMGSRESELTNLQFFKDNAIPAMAIMVSGGHLTGDSIDEIEELIYSVQGRGSVHRVMILEAEGAEKAASTDGKIPAPKIEIKPLAGDRQSDALFQEYDKNNQVKIRSSFRLPPIFIGLSEDLTHATAQASLTMAEAQVFGPERNKVDEFFNFVILSDKEGRPPAEWRFRSNPPRIADPDTLVDALTVFDQLGALTPNISIGIANELFDLSIEPIDADWGDYPFDIVMSLLSKGELKGIEEIREIPEPDDDDEKLPGAKLNGKQKQKVKEKILDPLKKLTETKDDVRTLRNRRRKSIQKKRKLRKS